MAQNELFNPRIEKWFPQVGKTCGSKGWLKDVAQRNIPVMSVTWDSVPDQRLIERCGFVEHVSHMGDLRSPPQNTNNYWPFAGLFPPHVKGYGPMYCLRIKLIGSNCSGNRLWTIVVSIGSYVSRVNMLTHFLSSKGHFVACRVNHLSIQCTWNECSHSPQVTSHAPLLSTSLSQCVKHFAVSLLRHIAQYSEMFFATRSLNIFWGAYLEIGLRRVVGKSRGMFFFDQLGSKLILIRALFFLPDDLQMSALSGKTLWERYTGQACAPPPCQFAASED